MEWIKIAIDYGIIGLLVLMSVMAVAIALERFLVMRRLDIRDYSDRRSLELELTRKLHLIGTIGANAPYVGLLGTVAGIMLTFSTMGQEGFLDTNKIMVGLALALKVTAVGLMVAIPSVLFYNLLQRRARVLLLEWEIEDGRKRV